MSEDQHDPNETEREYTEAARLMTGLSAIGHLIARSSSEVRRAFDALEEAASEEHALAREDNLSENEWVYNEDPSPLIHPDYTDPAKRRSVVVVVLDAEEGDLLIETAGPFPMVVGDDEEETSHIINSEGELIQHFEELYSSAVTTIRPMPFAASTTDSEDEDGYEIRDTEAPATEAHPALEILSRKKNEYQRAKPNTPEGQRERDAVIAALDTLQVHFRASL